MIDFSSEYEADLEPLLDLLVDGELDEARRRDLLSRLDAEPDGWRRCALSFLEAQAMHRELNCLIGREPTGPAAVARSLLAAPRENDAA